MIPSHGAPPGSPRLPSVVRIVDSARQDERLDPLAGLVGEDGVPLEARHVRTQRCEDRRLVPGPCAELQDPLARLRREELGHARHDPRLADRLSGVDGDGFVRVGTALPVAAEEMVPRDLGHRVQHALVADAAGA